MGSSDDYDTWCADQSHWATSTGVIQTYYDDFMLTGLSVREDHGAKVAIIAEPKNVGNANYEDHLWHMADSLESALLDAQAKTDGSHVRGVSDLASYAATWGVGALKISTYTLDDQIDLTAVASTHSTDVLNSAFASANVGDSASLLFASEETGRSTGLSDSTTSISGNTVNLSLSSATLDTTASLRWAPYQYAGAAVWDTLEMESYLATLDSGLQSAFTNTQLDLLVGNQSVSEYSLLRAGASGLGQNYYLSLYIGLSKTVAEDGVRFSTALLGNYALGSNEPATTIIKTLLEEIQIYYADLSIVDALSSTTSTTITAANSLAATFATSDSAILEALGNVAQGNISSALSLALGSLANYYKTTDVATTQFTSVGSLTALSWVSTLSAVSATGNSTFGGAGGVVLAELYSAGKIAMDVYTIVWGINAYNTYSSAIALANFTHLQPGAGNPTAALTYAAKADAVVKTNMRWAVATLIIQVAVIWGFFLWGYASGAYDNRLVRNAAIVKAVADTIVAIVMAVLAAIPVFGWIIVGVISLISSLMMAVCAAVGVKAGTTVDVWVCGGLTGALSQAIVYAIYDQYIVPNLNDSDRLSIGLHTPTLTQLVDDDGYLVGNQLNVSATITNTISKSKPTGLGSLEHFGYDLNALLRDSNFRYTLQSSKIDHHAGLKSGQLTWRNNTEIFSPTLALPFDAAGLNQTLPLYLTESFLSPTLECWGVLVQVCDRSNYKDSFHTYLGEDIVFDILPATIDEFNALTLVSNYSYRLGWDDRFPTLADGDGDGLLSQVKGGADPNDSLWDSDGDGLSDFWELENGFATQNSDSDGDGLYDYWEAFYDTDPYLSDSDSDGLSDSAEFFHSGSKNAYNADSSTWSGGWTFVYDYSGSSKLQTLVNAAPNDDDSDDDTISDRLEYVYGYNPNLASVLNVLSLDAQVAASVVAPGASLAYTATVKNELDNRVANGLLQAEFPVDTVQKTQVMQTLYPQEETTINGTVTAPSVSSTTATSVTLRAGAIIDEMDTGRVLWLHLTENSGATSFEDDAQSDNGPHNATCSGSACPTANGSFLQFDGSNDYLTVADDDELDLGNFTASLWVNPQKIGVQSLFAKGTTGLNIKTISDGKINVSLYQSDCTTPVSIQTTGALPTNSWQNLIVSYNGSTLALYLNGISVGSTSLASVCSNSSNITIGGGFKGLIREVELYTQGMTSSEVAALAKKPVFYLSSYRVPPNLVYSAKDEADYKASNVYCQVNASSDLACPSEESGIAGDGFTFDQTHGLKVTGSDVLDLGLIDDTFTMAMWLYPQSGYTPDDDHFSNYGQMLIGYDEDGLTHAYPSLYIKGKKIMVRFGHADEGGYCEATTGDILTYDSWQYLAVTFDNSQFKAYLNDTLVSTFTGSNCVGEAIHAGDDFYIGHGKSPALYFSQFVTDDQPKDDDAFLWSGNTLLNNGYGRQEIIWYVAAELDANKTIAIDKWAYNTGESFNFILCNANEAATAGCTDDTRNDPFFRDDGSESKTVNFYDTPGTTTERFYNEHGDGSGSRQTWHGWLTYKLYNDGFKGKMDEIRIYRTALNADEVAQVYAGSVRSLKLTFDEAPGQDIFDDSSGNEYDGTCSGKSGCPDSGIPARDNQAARFDGGVADDDGTDGIADYITLKDAESLGLKDASFTVLAWVKPDSLSGDRAILGTTVNQTQRGLHLILRDGKPYFGFYNADTASGTTLSTDKWTHLAWRYDKDNLTQSIYINGQLDAQGIGKAPFLGADTVYVGRSLSGGYFDGLIDHLVIVKEALTDDEIADIMQEAPTLNLHLDEDLSATTFANDSPYGNAATCSGTASGGSARRLAQRTSARSPGF